MFLIPMYPFVIPWLQPLYSYAPLLWLGGLVCLWLTRYTHQLAQRWGEGYYWASAIVRPLGVLLIAVGWMALFNFEEDVLTAERPGDWEWLLGLQHDHPTPLFWVNVMWMVGSVLSLGFGLWSVAVLGLRRSFLYRRLDDPLITRGPYGLVRHPQFLSAIGVTFFTVMFYITASSWDYTRGKGEWPVVHWGLIGIANWVLFTLALWLLAVLEDRELDTHFGADYKLYAHRVPRLFPN